jgi:hypothetical protein
LIQFLKTKRIIPLILGPCKVQFGDHPLWSKKRWFFFKWKIVKGQLHCCPFTTPSSSNEGHKSSPNCLILLPSNGNIATILKPPHCHLVSPV